MLQLLLVFFNAFKNKDVDKMVSCYHPDIMYTDPAFGVLYGADVKTMWQMLCKNAKDLDLDYWNIHKHRNGAGASYEAWYTFKKTGRAVYNVVDSTFEFAEGKIIKQRDDYDVHHWARQALGLPGVILGGTGFFKKRLQGETADLLKEFKKNEQRKFD